VLTEYIADFGNSEEMVLEFMFRYAEEDYD